MADSEGSSEQDDVSFLRTVSTLHYHIIRLINSFEHKFLLYFITRTSSRQGNSELRSV